MQHHKFGDMKSLRLRIANPQERLADPNVQVRAEGPKAPEAARPERAEAPSPGHRPGYDGNQQDAL